MGVRMKDGAGLLLSEASYVYNVNNQRIAKVVDGDGAGVGVAMTERFVCDGNQIALMFDGVVIVINVSTNAKISRPFGDKIYDQAYN
jgi:hypothetical protein